MIDGLDGVVVAVRDAAAAAETYRSLLGAEPQRAFGSGVLGADVTPLGVGTSEVWLARPTGPGPVADHLDRWGEGLVAVVLAAEDTRDVAKRLLSRELAAVEEGEATHLPPEATFGLRTVVVPSATRQPVGVLSFLYEVTHLVEDWRTASAVWAHAFGLEESRFCPIRSEQYGYEGVLTLFDPPARLDRIEVVTPDDPQKAMGRFFARRGEGPYMYYAECDDMAELKRRLDAAGARYASRDASPAPEGVFVHPSSLHGVLMGVSRTNLAWRWSGRPDLA